MAQLLEYIKMALKNIRSNKGRSILTMLGIIIGISSVIMIISIGNSVSGEISGELNNMAGGQLYIYSEAVENEEPVYFTEEDCEAIVEKIPHVKAATYNFATYGSAASPKGDFEAIVQAGNEGMEFYTGEGIIKGRYFSKSDNEVGAKVCVIRESSAITMFGTTDVLGKEFEVTMFNQSLDLQIVGIRADSSAGLLNGMMYGSNVEVEMPLNVLSTGFGFWLEDYDGFYIISDGAEYTVEIARQAISLLENRHNVQGKGMIKLQNFTDIMSQVNTVMGTITVFVVFVAAISLLVGGIGVMNIMLVSVTERTREIGIRKALGARTGSITLQFLSESAIITLIGGVIGIILGTLGAMLICALLGFSVAVSPGVVLGATLFSSAVGIFFGLYPARRAAKLSPIEALRHE